MLDKKILKFLKSHHILNLSVFDEKEIWIATCFYAFDENKISFFIASEISSNHIKMAQKNPKVAISIALETKIIGKIQGIQAKGEISKTDEKFCYFKKFPYAITLNPTIFEIKIDFLKFTNNSLGFGKKIIWQRNL